MKDNSLLDISIYQIKLFLLLAEIRNFSKVAALTNIAQPTLSKRISQLEQTLNMQLFVRNIRPIQLTQEGRTLYEGWASLCRQFEDAIAKAERQKNDSVKTITICTVDSGNKIISLPVIAMLIQEEFPELEINQRYLSFSVWREKLITGETDLMLTTLFDTENLDDSLEWMQLTVMPKEVCMLKTNPLSQKDRITFEDLKTQKFISISPMESLEYNRYIRSLCAEHGFEPDIVRYASNASNLIISLRKNNEVVICDSLIRDIDCPSLKRFPLPGVYSGLVAIWRKGNQNKYIPDIINIVKRYAEAVLADYSIRE